jgi:multidrug efflux pump subunit AcrA (membrane-fusion protein)
MTLDQAARPVAVSGGGGPERGQPPRRSAARRAGRIALHAAVVLAIAAAGLWAYRANVQSARPRKDMGMRVATGASPFPVALAAAERRPIAGAVTYTGSVAAFNEEDIYPRVTGRIVELPVYPGDPVRAGQVVARLDDVELSSRLRESEAMLAAAEASRLQMEAELAAARQGIVQMEKELAMVDAELAYARGVAARSERLVRTGAISRQEYENDASMAAALEAKREAARAKLEQARAAESAAGKKLDAAESMREQSRAAARTAKVVRDYVVIEAPSTGYVVKRLVAPGVLVQPGMAILKIAQIDRVRLQANVGERDLASIRVGSAVTVTPVGANQPPLGVKVTSVFPFVDQGPRTAVVEAAVDNSARRFLPGQYVLMQFSTGDRGDAVTVPRSAVARLGGASTVWVVKADRADRRSVVTGLESPDRVEIVQGLAAGERVVVRGGEGLYAGARVADMAATPEEDERRPVPGKPQPVPQPKEGTHERH